MANRRVRLASRRKAAGLSQERLAERLGVERTTVVRWETAETEPQPWVRPKLAALLGITPAELQELLNDVLIIKTEPDERIGYVLENPSSADLVTVAYLAERLREIGDSYDSAPSTSLLGPAGYLHGQVGYLREHVRSRRVRKALFEVEAESATLMGQLVWDVSQRRDHQGPVTYFDAAVGAARQVRDPGVESYAVLRKSYVALYGEKNPKKGLILAQEAAELATPSSFALAGLALLHVAEGFAMTGQRRECESALRKAEALFDRIADDDLAANHFSVNEYNRLAGSCYLFLDLPGRAEPILRPAVAALAAKTKSQAIALANLTLCLIRQRRLDEAAAAMHQTIDTVELTRGGGGLNLAFAAGRELREWRTEVWVQDINDRLLGLMSA